MSGFTKKSMQQMFRSLDRKSERELAQRYEQGAVEAGLFLLQKSQEVVPFETGQLHASGGVRKEGSGWDTKVFVFYTANYAIYVHENVAMKLKGVPRPSKLGKYWDAANGQGSSKFLERPMRRYRKQIILIIRNRMKKK